MTSEILYLPIDILNYKLSDILLDKYTILTLTYYCSFFDYAKLDYENVHFAKSDTNSYIFLPVCNNNCDCHRLLDIAKKVSNEIINILEYIISNKNKIIRVYIIGNSNYSNYSNYFLPFQIKKNMNNYFMKNILYLRLYIDKEYSPDKNFCIKNTHNGEYNDHFVNCMSNIFDRTNKTETKKMEIKNFIKKITSKKIENINFPFHDFISEKHMKTVIGNRVYKKEELNLDTINLESIHIHTAINLLNDKINTNVEKYEHEIKELSIKTNKNTNNNNEEIFEYIDYFCDEKIDNIYDKITNIEMTINDQYNELKNENKLLKNKINDLEKKIEIILNNI